MSNLCLPLNYLGEIQRPSCRVFYGRNNICRDFENPSW